jgi:hypothetical protein
VKNASRVLVCLPVETSEVVAAYQFVDDISRNFQHWDITILTNENNAPRQKSKLSVVTYSDSDLSRFNSPKKLLLQKFKNISCDLAIDLSIPFNFANLVILWKSDARLRIGFYHPAREDFYNFLLRLHSNTIYDNACQSLLKYLKSFQADKSVSV